MAELELGGYWVQHGDVTAQQQRSWLHLAVQTGINLLATPLRPQDEQLVRMAHGYQLRLAVEPNGLSLEQLAAWSKKFPQTIKYVLGVDDYHMKRWPSDGTLTPVSGEKIRADVQQIQATLGDTVTVYSTTAFQPKLNALYTHNRILEFCNLLPGQLGVQLYSHLTESSYEATFSPCLAALAEQLPRTTAILQCAATQPLDPGPTSSDPAWGVVRNTVVWPTLDHLVYQLVLARILGVTKLWWYALVDHGGLEMNKLYQQALAVPANPAALEAREILARRSFLTEQYNRAALAEAHKLIALIEPWMELPASFRMVNPTGLLVRTGSLPDGSWLEIQGNAQMLTPRLKILKCRPVMQPHVSPKQTLEINLPSQAFEARSLDLGSCSLSIPPDPRLPRTISHELPPQVSQVPVVETSVIF